MITVDMVYMEQRVKSHNVAELRLYCNWTQQDLVLLIDVRSHVDQ